MVICTSMGLFSLFFLLGFSLLLFSFSFYYLLIVCHKYAYRPLKLYFIDNFSINIPIQKRERARATDAR